MYAKLITNYLNDALISGHWLPMRNYWLNLFSPSTWQEFLDAGANISGFRENRWATVQKIKPGDYLLCYLTQVSRFIGVLEVESNPYQDHDHSIWRDESFPCRVNVHVVVKLSLDEAIPIAELSDRLSIFRNPYAWTGHVRGSPSKWTMADGDAVVQALQDARTNPIVRPIDPSKLSKRPRVVRTKIGPVTVPESEDEPEEIPNTFNPSPESGKESTSHTEIQWHLLRLGNDMGLDVWVARNDRSRDYGGHRFADLPRMREELPHQFDEATHRTVELIDVLWLRRNAIVAAFEIESTTSIYSGLLRMSDLIAMQPNLNIPLYLVAPDERRNKVLSEVNRPTFSRLSPPMKELCRYLSFSTVREQLPHDPRIVPYLKPDILEEFSESCEIESI